MSDDQLPALMQRLPQELYDKIHELVFAVEEGERIIGQHYTFPFQLHVDHASRERFAELYYGCGSTFTFPGGRKCKLSGWIKTTRTPHFDKVLRISIPLPKTEGQHMFPGFKRRRKEEYDITSDFIQCLRSLGYSTALCPGTRFRPYTAWDVKAADGAQVRWQVDARDARDYGIAFEKT